MRRTVATLLVVATAFLMAVPVGASGAPTAGPAAPPLPAAPAALPATAAPAPVVVAPPATPAVATVPAPAGAVTAVPAPAPVRRAVKAIRVKTPVAAGLSDAAYAERLQAELCMARQIFCGLDHSGRYPAR